MFTDNPAYDSVTGEVGCSCCPLEAINGDHCLLWMHEHQSKCPTAATYQESAQYAKENP